MKLSELRIKFIFYICAKNKGGLSIMDTDTYDKNFRNDSDKIVTTAVFKYFLWLSLFAVILLYIVENSFSTGAIIKDNSSTTIRCITFFIFFSSCDILTNSECVCLKKKAGYTINDEFFSFSAIVLALIYGYVWINIFNGMILFICFIAKTQYVMTFMAHGIEAFSLGVTHAISIYYWQKLKKMDKKIEDKEETRKKDNTKVQMNKQATIATIASKDCSTYPESKFIVQQERSDRSDSSLFGEQQSCNFKQCSNQGILERQVEELQKLQELQHQNTAMQNQQERECLHIRDQQLQDQVQELQRLQERQLQEQQVQEHQLHFVHEQQVRDQELHANFNAFGNFDNQIDFGHSFETDFHDF